jgi:hypothetical protein
MDIRPLDESKSADGSSTPQATAEAPSHQAGTDLYARKAIHSVILAILSPLSMFITAPLAAYAMLGTYPSMGGPSPMPWVTPLVFFGLPLLLAVPSLVLAITVIMNSSDTSPNRPPAAITLCIGGLVVALALGPALDLLGSVW